MKLRIGDLAIALIIAAAALCIWIFPSSGSQGEFAGVRIDGALEKTLDLRGGAGEYTFSGVTVKIEDGGIRVSNADCPDQVCVKTGEISKPGQAIVCVPNRVSVEITGEAEVDAIVGG